MLVPSPGAPVGRLVAERPARAAVFERFGIDYCCEGRASLGEACSRRGAEVEEVLRALASCDAQPPRADEPRWAEWTLERLLDHVLERHHAFLRRELGPLGALAHRVAGAHAAAHPEMATLAKAFDFLREDLEAHLAKEEEILFPALRALERGGRLPGFFADGLNVPLLVMEGDHQRVEQSLRYFRTVTHDYLAPEDACDAWRALAGRLLDLERDLHRHVHLENEVIHVRARELAARG